MRLLDRILASFRKREKARHARWLRKNRIPLAPDRAVTTSVNGGWWLR